MFATLLVLLAVLPVLFFPYLAGNFFQPVVVSFVLGADCLAGSRADGHACAMPGSAWRSSTGPPRVAAGAWAAACLRRSAGASDACAVRGAGGGGRNHHWPALQRCRMLGWSPLPSFKQTDLMIQWQGAPGTSLEAMNRITAQVTQELRCDPWRAQRRLARGPRRHGRPGGGQQFRHAVGQSRSGCAVCCHRGRRERGDRRLSGALPYRTDVSARENRRRADDWPATKLPCASMVTIWPC